MNRMRAGKGAVGKEKKEVKRLVVVVAAWFFNSEQKAGESYGPGVSTGEGEEGRMKLAKCMGS